MNLTSWRTAALRRIRELTRNRRQILYSQRSRKTRSPIHRELPPSVEVLERKTLLAADLVRQLDGRYGADQLQAYETRLTARLGKPRTYQAAGWLPAAWLQGVAARLMASRWFAKNVVMDNWFLRRRQQALSL